MRRSLIDSQALLSDSWPKASLSSGHIVVATLGYDSLIREKRNEQAELVRRAVDKGPHGHLACRLLVRGKVSSRATEGSLGLLIAGNASTRQTFRTSPLLHFAKFCQEGSLSGDKDKAPFKRWLLFAEA